MRRVSSFETSRTGSRHGGILRRMRPPTPCQGSPHPAPGDRIGCAHGGGDCEGAARRRPARRTGRGGDRAGVSAKVRPADTARREGPPGRPQGSLTCASMRSAGRLWPVQMASREGPIPYLCLAERRATVDRRACPTHSQTKQAPRSSFSNTYIAVCFSALRRLEAETGALLV